jgi:hypothetical protein
MMASLDCFLDFLPSSIVCWGRKVWLIALIRARRYSFTLYICFPIGRACGILHKDTYACCGGDAHFLQIAQVPQNDSVEFLAYFTQPGEHGHREKGEDVGEGEML